MASSNEGPKPPIEAEKIPEKDQITSTGRSGNSLRIQRSSKKESTSHENCTEKTEAQHVIKSVSSETDVNKKLKGEKKNSLDEKVTIAGASTALEINDSELAQTDVSKSLDSEDIHGEITEEKIESAAVYSSLKTNLDGTSSRTNNHPPKRIKLEWDSSRPHIEAESTNALTTPSGLDYDDQHSEEESSSLSGLFRHGIRSTGKHRKGNERTPEHRMEFPVKYLRVHGESDGAYKNESEPRGLIFMKNMESFKSRTYNPRNGSKEDYTNLLNLFLQMGYIPAEDLCQSGSIKKDKLLKDLKTFAKMNHKNYDSAIIIILSHGVEDKTFMTSDEKEVELSKLYSILNNNNCSSLKDKPKIFIFQFCRPAMQKHYAVHLVNSIGEGLNITIPKTEKKTDIRKMLLNFFSIAKLQDGSDQSLNRAAPSQLDVRFSDDSETELDDEDVMTEANHPGMEMDSSKPFLPMGPDLAPDNSDMYSIFATQAGGVAYRDPRKGSLLIQAICDVFSKHAYHDDIDALVRKVSQRVHSQITDIQSQDAAPTRPGVVERVNNGLDKLFYFNPFPMGVMIDQWYLGGHEVLKNKSVTSPRNLAENNIKSGSECATQTPESSFIGKYVKVYGDQDGAYKNEKEPRGLILIKNIITFDDASFECRDGSEKDFTDLRTLFHQMGYAEGESLCESGYINFKSLEDDLKTFSQLDHQKYDSAIIIIMSHGIDDSTFVTSDGVKMKVDNVQNIFNNINCPGLLGKPKVLILHFCRPEIFVKSFTWNVDDIQLQVEMSSKSEQIGNLSKSECMTKIATFFLTEILPSHERINPVRGNPTDGEPDSQIHRSKSEESHDSSEPLHDAGPVPERITGAGTFQKRCDMITIFSNTSGGLAYRDPKKGSLMIQSLCQILSEHAHYDHIEDLLRKVTEEMEKKTEKSKSLDVGNESAVVDWHCNLKKLFYFNPRTERGNIPGNSTEECTNA